MKLTRTREFRRIQDTVALQVFGVECRCLSLKRLIIVKRAAGRPKDLEAIAELEAILEERSQGVGFS